jgi:glycosyltransferase involved in cell wall biosynthesis
MIKILFVIGQLGYGGAERQLVYLASNLDRNKYQVLVCSLSDNVPLKKELDAAAIETVVIPQVMKPDLTRPLKLFKIAKLFQPDLIHSYLFVADTWSRIVGRILNVPVIISERSSQYTEPQIHKILKKLLRSFGDALIANSEEGAKKVLKNCEFEKDVIFIVHNGIDVNQFMFLDKTLIKKDYYQFGLNRNERIIGVVANLKPEKNHEMLLNAFCFIKKRIPNSKLLCIGEGPRKDELVVLSKSLGIEDSVVFAGRRDDIPECLSLMDVLVLPSKWEGCPNVILEAMAANVPVVATDVGGVGEIVKDGKTGWLVQPDDPQELALKIAYVFNNPVLVKSVCKQAYEYVQKNHSIQRLVNKTTIVYEQLSSNNQL